MKPNVEQFEKAGATPSVGQATGSAFMQGLENVVSTMPGGGSMSGIPLNATPGVVAAQALFDDMKAVGQIPPG